MRMSVSFYLESRLNAGGERPIRVRVCVRSANVLTTIGHSVPDGCWSQSRQEVVRPCVNAMGESHSVINALLVRIRSHFLDWECGLKPDSVVSRDVIYTELGKVCPRSRGASARMSYGVVGYFDMFLSEGQKSGRWSSAMIDCYIGLRRHLKRMPWLKSFDSLTEDGLDRFVDYFVSVRKVQNRTTEKQYCMFRTFLGWAYRKGYCTNTAFMRHKASLRVARRPVVFLTVDELSSLYSYRIPEDGEKVTLTTYDGAEYERTVRNRDRLEIARDLFVFCCSTSLRYSDMSKLRRSDITDSYISVTTQKTIDDVRIELNSRSREILGKYSGRDFGSSPLPKMCNKELNECIKILCELCGINSPVRITKFRGAERKDEVYPKYALVGSHCGRRTFVCNALSAGIPPQTVMKWTGHSDWKSMRPYIDIADSARSAAMAVFDSAVNSSKGDDKKEHNAPNKKKIR